MRRLPKLLAPAAAFVLAALASPMVFAQPAGGGAGDNGRGFIALGAALANYLSCTIEPNVGVVPVPDARLDALVALYRPKSTVAATVNFVDIAGLVRGASKGEGLGNQFLANIRETDAIAHVVRCFEDQNIIHVEGRIDPVTDVQTIDTELCLKDLESVDKRIERARKALKGPTAKEEKLTLELCERIRQALDRGVPVRAQRLTPEEQALIRDLFLRRRGGVRGLDNQAGRPGPPGGGGLSHRFRARLHQGGGDWGGGRGGLGLRVRLPLRRQAADRREGLRRPRRRRHPLPLQR